MHYNQPRGPPPPQPQAANIIDLPQVEEHLAVLGPDLVDIFAESGILQVATNIDQTEQQLQEDLIKQTVELQDFYEDDLSQYTSDRIKTAIASELHSLSKKNVYSEVDIEPLTAEQRRQIIRCIGSSNLDHLLPLLMTLMILHATLKGMHLHLLKSDGCVQEEKHHSFGIRRRLAHRRNVKGYKIVSGATSTISQPQTLHCPYITTTSFGENASADIQMVTSQSPWREHTTTACSRTSTTVLHQHRPCGDLQHNKIYISILIDITSTRILPQSCWHAHLGSTSTSRPAGLQHKTTLDILHLQQNGTGNISSTLSGTSREPCTTSSSSHLSCLKVTHYPFSS